MLINSYKNDLNYYNSRNNFNCRMTKCLIHWSRLSVDPGRLKETERFTWITFNLDNNNYAKKYVFKWKERTGDTLKLKINSSVSFRIFQKCAGVPLRTCITPLHCWNISWTLQWACCIFGRKDGLGEQ